MSWDLTVCPECCGAGKVRRVVKRVRWRRHRRPRTEREVRWVECERCEGEGVVTDM